MNASMSDAPTSQSTVPKPLRLWPGIVAVSLQFLLRFVLPVIAPDAVPVAVIGGLAGGLAMIVWWLFFSRAAWVDRLGAIGLMAIGLFATSRCLDKSITTGAQGLLFY